MKLKVVYITNISKDVRRMVNWHLVRMANAAASTSGMADLSDVTDFYQKYGEDQMDIMLEVWIKSGRPE